MPASPLAPMLRHFQKLVAASKTEEAADARLLAQFIRDKSEEAFAAIVWRHGPLVWRVCRRVLGRGDGAEDAFQATFLVLARKARSIKKPSSLPSWLHGVAFRMACQLRSQIDGSQPAGSRAPAKAVPDPAHEAALCEAGRIIEEEVHRLAEHLRLPVLLCYWEGKTNEETARALGWPQGTVKTRLAKARTMLHERLLTRGVTLPAGVIALALAPPGAEAALPAALAAKTTVGMTLAPNVAVLVEQALPSVAANTWKPLLLLVLAGGALAVGGGAWINLGPAPTSQLQARASAAAAVASVTEPSEKPATTDLFGDSLPAGASARLGTVQFRHAAMNARAIPLTFSADGKMLISASHADRKLRWFDAATGKPKTVRDLEPVDDRYWSPFEPVDERYWPSLVLSRDGSALAAVVGRQSVFLWKTDAAEPPRQIAFPGFASPILALSANGRFIAAGSRSRSMVHIRDLKTNREQLSPLDEPASELVFSEDAKYLAAFGRESMIVFEVETGKEVRVFPTKVIGTVAFSPDNKILAGCRSGEKNTRSSGAVLLWDLKTGEVLHELPRQYYPVLFSPDGKLLATRSDEGIRLWDPASGREVRKKNRPQGYEFAFSPDSKSLAFRSQAAIRVWNLDTDRVLSNTEGHHAEVSGLVFSPDGKWLASEGLDAIRLWEASGGSKSIREFPPIQVVPSFLTFSADSKTLLAYPVNRTVRRWEVPGGGELPGYGAPELALPTSPFAVLPSTDGTMLLALENKPGAAPRLIKRVDLATGKELWRGVQDLTFPEIASRDGKIRGAAALARLVPVHEFNSQWLSVFNFSADGRSLAVTRRLNRSLVPTFTHLDPPGLEVWDTVTGDRICKLPVSPSLMVAFSRTGRYLAVAGLDALQVFDLTSSKEILRRTAPERFRSFSGGEAFVCSLAFAPDAGTLATGMADGTILFWPVFVTSRSNPKEHVTSADLDRLWSDLAADASKGCVALWKLAEAPEAALPYLKERLRPAAPLDPTRIKRLIADLGSDAFAQRDRAFRELGALGEQVEPFLQHALAQQPSLELKRRAEALLAANPNPEVLRRVRAIAALEHIGTRAARDLLQTLARGEPSARETWEAERAAQRLSHRLP